MNLIVGLTGGIGSGKTAASDYLAQKGITVVDSDVIAREVVEPEQPAWLAIRDHFGPEAILPSGELNRPWLRDRVFQQPSERTWLEQQTHPAIRALTIQRLNRSQSPYAILASPLLFESGQDALVNRTLIIDVPEELQVERSCQRDTNSPEQIRRIIRSQISRDQRRNRANDIVDNSGSLPQLWLQLDQLHQQYLQLSSSMENLSI